MEPAIIAPEADSFEVDGVRYTRTADISISRYRRLQKWEVEFGFDGSLRGVWEATSRIKEIIDERKSISDIAFENENLRRGLQNLDRNLLFELQVVSLWYLSGEEDPAVYDHEANVDKINRWEAAGLGMGFFFTKAAGCARGFREAWLHCYPAAEPSPAPLPNPPLPPS